MSYINLHNHTEYSALDGVGKVSEYAKRASELGQKAIAMTDHGNIDGAIKFQKACEKENIQPIFGIEFYMVPNISIKQKGEKRAHICAYAKNEIGWKSILGLVSLSNINGFFYRPRISPDDLIQYSDGLIVSTACSASFINFDWGEELLCDLKDVIKDDIYLEVMPHLFDSQLKTNITALELSKKYDIKLIATNDAHYVHKEDEITQEVLLAVQTNKKWDDPARWKFDGGGYYLKSKLEMARGFREQGVLSYEEYTEAMENTLEIADKCKDFKISKKEISLPSLKTLYYDKDMDNLKDWCYDGLAEKNLNNDIYKKRLEEELFLIEKQGFEKYFIVVWELINWCRDNDIMTGPGRGSSGGSLVCYLLGITKVDPIKYNLLFSRFISPDRIDIPDIDIDFEDIKRPLIRKHLEELYGKWSVAGISTFSEMKGKGSIRDVSRVFNVPLKDVNKACMSIVTKLDGDDGSTETISEAFEMSEDGKWFREKYPQVTDIAMRLEGQIRNRGQHAAAIVIADEDLREGNRCGFVLGKDKEPIINWDKDDIEYVGLMKLDVLGLKMLTALNDTRKRVLNNHGVELVFENIPLDDKKCLEEFSKGNSIGCFQVGSQGLRKFCQRLGIDDFMMLVHATSLYRPGTLRSGMADVFVKRKNGEEQVPYTNRIFDEITKDTYGIILYQEQVMRLVVELAGLDWPVADKVRKVIAKSKGEDALRKYEDEFVDGCVETGNASRERASEIWNDIVSFGGYGFNLSHAVEYSMITFWDMYCKLYYPTEFICSMLTYGTDKDDKKDEYIEEAFRLGLDVRPPKIGYSNSTEWVEKDGILYAPFVEIKGIGDKTAVQFENINKESFYGDNKISKRFLNILDKINADKNEPLTDEEADRVSDYLGISLVKNRLFKYKKLVKTLNKNDNFTVAKKFDTNKLSIDNKYIIGIISELKLKYKNTKDGKVGTASGTIKDDSGYLSFVFSAEIYEKRKHEIETCEDQMVVIAVNVPRREGNIICNNIWFNDEIMSCDLDGLDIQMYGKARYCDEKLLECNNCGLRLECKSPVLPSPGSTNLMIIGEAPGRNEDNEGYGFVGDVGNVLWNELDNYGLRRREFYCTHFVKCYPSKTKTPVKEHIETCREWLKGEIDIVKPSIVLAFGNTAIKFFTDEETGIMKKNATTEWNERYGLWICWCIHPASVLYHSENITLFSEAVKNFVEKSGIIAF